MENRELQDLTDAKKSQNEIQTLTDKLRTGLYMAEQAFGPEDKLCQMLAEALKNGRVRDLRMVWGAYASQTGDKEVIMAGNTHPQNLPEPEEKMTEWERLTKRLIEVKGKVAQAYGTGDVLFRLIEKATEDAYIRHVPIRELRMAMAAYEAQLPELKEWEATQWGEAPKITKEKVEEAARIGKPLRLVLQIDGHDPEELLAGINWEPKRHEVPVRLHVLAGTPKGKAIQILGKILEWLEEDWNQLTKLSNELFSRNPLVID